METIPSKQLYFKEPRLMMNFVSRLIARVFIFLFYVALGGVAWVLSSANSNIKYLGFLLILFLVDRVIYLREPKNKFNKRFTEGIKQGKRFNLADFSDDTYKRFLEVAGEKTFIARGNFYLRLLDEFLALGQFQKVLKKIDVPVDEFRYALREEIKKSAEIKEERKDKNEILLMAESLVINSLNYCNSEFLKSKDLFVALFFVEDAILKRLLSHFKIEAEDIKVAVIFSDFRKKLFGIFGWPKSLSGFTRKFSSQRHRVMNRAWTAKPTPYLDSISIDLTDFARRERIGFLIGHKNEYQRMVDILSRSDKNNALLVGELGIGKEAMVRHLAYNISKDRVPEKLFDKRLVKLLVSQLVAGGTPEQVLERSHRALNEVLIAGNVILYIPDINNLVKTSGGQYLSAADAFLSVMSRSDFQVVGYCGPDVFKKDIEPKKDFLASFEVIRVEELSEEEAIELLCYDSLILESQFKIDISFKAIKKAVGLSHRYFRDKLLPQSAQDLLKESLSFVKNKGEKVLTEEDIVQVCQQKLNVPLSETTEVEAESLLNLEDKIHERLIDQEEAVKAVSRSLREYRAGLSRKGGPIASFLFTGPTGVGKTELAKILSKLQFGSDNSFLRFDMSEYQDKKSTFRFIGSPEGELPGALTEAVRQKPFSLILLDEFEKAHPDILNIFLAVFDDGRLTDNVGRVIDFTNTIIIATSNAHSELIKQELEEGKNIMQITADVKKRLTEYFKPELLNRFSSIVAFKTLSPQDVRKISIILLKEITGMMEENQGVEISFDNSAIDKLLELGYNPVYGARPMRNAISDNVKSVLADKILRKEFKRGDKVVLKYDGVNFVVEKN
jgi:ATP-dependent Clp protease ATP-binding subunit ClpC